ncbi:hypothetical protein M9Y10_029538 [Tritrichomonas musculus]|uniref:Uncharacterized protein n=1 Tax=Tritrichomonas musculus TaxID=1915356 RepID=A0ABR2KMF2_9EUKA
MLDFVTEVVIPWKVVNTTCDPRKTNDFLFLAEQIRNISVSFSNLVNILDDVPKEADDGIHIYIVAQFSIEDPEISNEKIDENLNEIKEKTISIAQIKRDLKQPKIILHKKE